VCLLYGIGISKDLISAAQYFQLSADQGDANSQLGYDLCRLGGIGISKDLMSAAQYFNFSADQGNGNGQFWYGQCLRDGIGISDISNYTHNGKIK
jgi:TPR repeat protein